MSRRNINSGVANNILYPAKFPTSLAGITLAYVVVQNTTLNMNTILLFTSLRLCTQYVYKTSLLMSLSFRLFFTFLFISIPVVSFPFVFQFHSLYFLLSFLFFCSFLCFSILWRYIHLLFLQRFTPTLFTSPVARAASWSWKRTEMSPIKHAKIECVRTRDIRRERRTPESHDVRNIAPRIMEDVKRKEKKKKMRRLYWTFFTVYILSFAEY